MRENEQSLDESNLDETDFEEFFSSLTQVHSMLYRQHAEEVAKPLRRSIAQVQANSDAFERRLRKITSRFREHRLAYKALQIHCGRLIDERNDSALKLEQAIRLLRLNGIPIPEGILER